jgi:putative restriction endonuclease
LPSAARQNSIRPVRGYVANTDFDWFTTLRTRAELEEINFWQPSGGNAFRVISPGELVFFRLKSPRNAIGGFAIFARHVVIPAWHAWDTFAEGNGARDFPEMLARIAHYRRSAAGFRPDPHGNYLIGCILLVEPVFFGPDEWVREPEGWPRNVVQGKSYNLSTGEGARLVGDCFERLEGADHPTLAELRESARRFGSPHLVTPRLGQGTFRIAVETAYDRACAVTGEHSLPVLEAAHIQPYALGGEHLVPNGLLLRRDVHRLFDRGYVTVTPEARFEVSRALRDEFANGRTYYALHGAAVTLPSRLDERPSPSSVRWHNETVFRG